MSVPLVSVSDSSSRGAAVPVPDPVSDYRGAGGNGTGAGTGPGSGRCGRCDPESCPEPRGCRAGSVPDRCGCCQECGNSEGQACDPGARTGFYGSCGTGSRCRAEDGEDVCVCEQQEASCGSDGNTYSNRCQFGEAAFSDPELRTAGAGPCRTVPVIKVPPQNQVNGSGSSSVFLCEVFAFPMASVEWRKDGQDVVLPGDDPHISVQARGGPSKFELSSWSQIEGAEPGDSGTYRCTAQNDSGSVSASAESGISGAEESSSYSSRSVSEMKQSMDDYDHDYL